MLTQVFGAASISDEQNLNKTTIPYSTTHTPHTFWCIDKATQIDVCKSGCWDETNQEHSSVWSSVAKRNCIPLQFLKTGLCAALCEVWFFCTEWQYNVLCNPIIYIRRPLLRKGERVREKELWEQTQSQSQQRQRQRQQQQPQPQPQQNLLHTKTFTQRSLYTEKLLHADAFTPRSFYTENSLHRGAFTRSGKLKLAAILWEKPSQELSGTRLPRFLAHPAMTSRSSNPAEPTMSVSSKVSASFSNFLKRTLSTCSSL